MPDDLSTDEYHFLQPQVSLPFSRTNGATDSLVGNSQLPWLSCSLLKRQVTCSGRLVGSCRAAVDHDNLPRAAATATTAGWHPKGDKILEFHGMEVTLPSIQSWLQHDPVI